MTRRTPRARRAASAALLALAALGARRAAGQDGGRNAAIVLALPASARAAALGDAYLGVGGDDAALFYDPAQLATVRGAVGLSVERYLASSVVAAASAAARVGRGSAAVGVQSIRYDGIDETVASTATGRTLSAGDAVATVGYGVGLGRLRLPGATALRVGATVKYARQRVAEASGGALAGDVAVAAALRGGGVLSVVAQNLGGDITLLDVSSPLPRRVRVGGALPVAVSPRVSMLATAAVTRGTGGGVRAAGGVEARWLPGAVALDLRVGARQRPDGGAASPVTVGAGVAVRGFTLDYAYQGYSVLGSTHRLGARWSR